MWKFVLRGIGELDWKPLLRLRVAGCSVPLRKPSLVGDLTLLVDQIKVVLKDVCLFVEHTSGLKLREYQIHVARVVAESVIFREGKSFVVMFPRQSGKNELQAQIETYLLTLLSQIDCEIVKISPTWKPQSLNAMRRLQRVLENNVLVHSMWKKESGYIYKIGKARIFFFSGSPEANIVGATAGHLLEVDEAQDVLVSKFDKDIAPMAASTNATRVFWGTAWTSDTLLARELRAAKDAEVKDGMRRVFVLTAEDVAREVPAYGLFVAEQVAKLGRNHPMIRTQFFSEEIDGEGGLFPESRRVLMVGLHEKQVQPKAGRIYAMMIDIAGEEEEKRGEGHGDGRGMPTPIQGEGRGAGHGQAMPVQRDVDRRGMPTPIQAEGGGDKRGVPTTQQGGRRDATALTVVEVDLATMQDELIKAPTYKVMFRKVWVGVQHTRLYGEILALAKLWEIKRLVVDATGVGAGLSSFLERALPGKVIQFRFNAATKSQLGWDFLSVVDTGRFKDYSPADYEQELFWSQLAACQYSITTGIDRKMKWGVPDGMRNAEGEYVHDDLILSAALCAVLDGETWSVGGEALVVKGVDPLREMDKEGF